MQVITDTQKKLTAEFQAVGLGDYAGDYYTENEFRTDLGEPLRDRY
jgi:hypothetical protein